MYCYGKAWIIFVCFGGAITKRPNWRNNTTGDGGDDDGG